MSDTRGDAQCCKAGTTNKTNYINQNSFEIVKLFVTSLGNFKEECNDRSFKIVALPCTGVKEIPATPSKFFLAGYKCGLLKQNEKYKWYYFVKRLLSPTDTIVDIGANLGYFSIIFSKIINDNGILLQR